LRGLSIETMEQEAWGRLIMEHPRVQGLSEWRPLASGGRTVVWAARQLTLDRPVAVKVYQRKLDEGDRRRFLREAAAARLSDHPGIVTAHDAGILPDDRPYLIMDLCSGGSLTEWLKPENRPSEERVRQVGVRIADALAAVHAGGVLHRDVKPANILIDSFGNPGLGDFGLAAVAGAETTAADAAGVTSAYAPPEALGMQPATESGDVFSLAATLYALLAGRPPRNVGAAAPVALEQTVEVARRPIGPIPRVNRYLPIPGVNRYLMDVLMTALSNDPVDRPTAARFRDQLRNVPATSISKRGAHVGDSDGSSSVFQRGGALVPGHSAISNSHSIAVTAVTADPQQAPGQVAADKAQRWRGKRRVVIPALAAALVTVIAPTTAWLISEPAPSALTATITPSATLGPPSSAGPSQASDPRPPTSTTTPGAGDNAGTGSSEQQTIQLENSADSAKPFQTVQIRGTYRGGADTFLKVQRWEGDKWQPFPLPTKTDKSGQFTAYVEFPQAGSYRVRVLNPDSGVTSKPSVLVIKS
jgi:serine/threonine protein kinase